MVHKKALFQWLDREDTLWIEPDQILCKVSEPVPTGKFGRMFKLSEFDRDRINESFEGFE